MAGITKAIVKKFIDYHKGKLFIKIGNRVVPAITCETKEDGNYGVAGIWFASRNRYQVFDNGIYTGYKIYNNTMNSYVLIQK
jgi:hypothetical protein